MKSKSVDDAPERKQTGDLEATRKETGRGLAPASLLVGLATGAAVYGVVEYWIDGRDLTPLATVSLQSIIYFSAGWLLLAERRDYLRPILPAAVIAALLAGPTWFMTGVGAATRNDMAEFPFAFWFLLSAPLAFYLMLSLAKAAIETGTPPHYRSLFFHGLTLPLIASGAKLFAGLTLALLFAWAALLKQMDVAFFSTLFDEPWFILPFLGAIGGLSIAMIRGQQAVVGALRYVLLLFSRIAMPIMAIFSATFLIALALKGPGAILGADFFFDRPGGMILFLAFSGMLIFNGVYQNGEGAPPPAWLRLSTILVIACFPVYTGLAFHGLWTRVAEYGLTPPRIGGLAMTALSFAYSFVLLAGLLTEVRWKATRWMPLVAPANTLMASLWVVVLLALSSPLFNPWSMSAKSQEALLLSRSTGAEDFDYGYLRFRLGRSGEAALARIEQATGHPQAAAISVGVNRARAAQSYWEYQHPEIGTPAIDAPAAEPADAQAPDRGEQPGPMDLQLNPDDAPDDTSPDN